MNSLHVTMIRVALAGDGFHYMGVLVGSPKTAKTSSCLIKIYGYKLSHWPLAIIELYVQIYLLTFLSIFFRLFLCVSQLFITCRSLDTPR